MGEKTIKFTDDRIRKLQHDGSRTRSGKLKRIYYWDSQQAGLALQITPSGTKTFQFRKWDAHRGCSVTLVLGRYGSISLKQARELAAGQLVELNAGADILENSRSLKKQSSLNDIFDHWLEHHAKPHKRTWDGDQRRYNLYCRKQIGQKKVSWFTPDRVRSWHRDITRMVKQRADKQAINTKDGERQQVVNYVSSTTANRALTLLSTVFNQLGYDNPCKGVKKFKETSRDRYIKKSELKRFFDALFAPETHDDLRDYVLLSLFTGGRQSNVLAMKWGDIDFRQKQWTISGSESKNGEPMLVPLISEALEVLERRRSVASSVFVLPGRGRSGHYLYPFTAWTGLLKRARIEDLRMHDLRRTMGSYQTMSGASSTVVGKSLGHKSQAATAVYARLDIDTERESMANAAGLMNEYRYAPEKVVELKK